GGAVAVPIDETEFAAAAFAAGAGGEVQRLIVLVAEDALGREQHEFAVAFGALEEGEVAFLVEHHEVHEAIVIPIHGEGRGAPLGEQRFALRFLPAPAELGRGAVPLDFDGLRGGELRRGAGADVAIPDDLAPDGIDDEIGQAVAVPIRDAEGGVAPLRLGGTLDAAIRAGHDADTLTIGLEILRRGPLRLFHARSAEIFDEADVAGAVAADD